MWFLPVSLHKKLLVVSHPFAGSLFPENWSLGSAEKETRGWKSSDISSGYFKRSHWDWILLNVPWDIKGNKAKKILIVVCSISSLSDKLVAFLIWETFLKEANNWTGGSSFLNYSISIKEFFSLIWQDGHYLFTHEQIASRKIKCILNDCLK